MPEAGESFDRPPPDPGNPLEPEAGDDEDFRPQLAAKVGVAIVCRDCPEDVEACLAALAPQLELNNAHAVVVDVSGDAASADRIAAYLAPAASGGAAADRWKSRAFLLRARPPRTDASAFLVALGFLRAESYLLLHPAARLRIGALSALVDAALEKGVAAATPTLVGGPYAGRAVAHFGGWPLNAASEFLAACGADFPAAAPATDYAVRAPLECILVRAAALDRAGGIDPSLSSPFAGADLSRRLRRRAGRIAYATGAHVEFADESDFVLDLAPGDDEAFFANRAAFHRKSGSRGLLAANLGWRAGRVWARVRNISGRDDRHTHHPSMDKATARNLSLRRTPAEPARG